MSMNIESTTDSKDQVLAAIGGAKSVEKVEEQKKAVSSRDDESQQDESEQEESETSEDNLDDNDSDASVSEDDEEIKDDLKEDQKPKKRSGFQRRIDKFQKKLSERDQEIEQLRKAVASGAGKPLEQTAQETKNETVSKPDPASFDSHQDYVEALTDWKIEQREKVREINAKEAQFKTEYQKQVSAFQSKVSEFSKSTPDFNDVISDVDDVPLRESIQDALLTSDLGPQLMYELSKNRAELLRINSMSPLAAAREIGKIEARLSQNLDSPKTKEVKLTKTPPPIEPVGSKSAGKTFKSPEDMTIEEYRAWRTKK